MTIVTRKNLGRPLTWDELDGNFQQVDSLVAQASDAVSTAQGAATTASNNAEQAAQSAIDAAASAQSAGSAVTRSLRAPAGETLNELPAVASRQNKVQTFNSSGQPTVTDITSFAQVDNTGKIPATLLPDTVVTSVNSKQGSVTLYGSDINNSSIDSETVSAALSRVQTLPDDTVMFMHFRSDADIQNYIAISQNGRFFEEISDIPLKVTADATAGTSNLSDGFAGRDVSFVWFNNQFIAAVTDYVAGSYDTTILTSVDLLNWTRRRVKFGSGVVSATVPAPGATHACDKAWAPSLFVYNNELYCGISLPFGNDFVDINGNTIPDFRQYLSKCTDISTFTFNTVSLITQTANTRAQIDGHYTFLSDNLWHMFTKNEYAKTIEHWTSSALFGPYSLNSTPISTIQCEAPTLVVMNQTAPKYRLYADAYSVPSYVYSESNDLVTWTAPVNVVANRRFRHGELVNVGSLPKKAQVALENYCSTGVLYDNRNTTVSANNASFSPRDGFIYSISGTDQFSLTISEAGAETFKVRIASALPSCTLTFPVSTYFDGVNQGKPLILNGFDHGNRIITFRKINSKYYTDAGCSPDTSSVAFSTVTGFPNISNFAPVIGTIYTTDGTSTYSAVTNINSISTAYPDGAYFYINRQNETATNGNILLKYDANSIAVASAGISLTATDLRIYTVRKIAGKWRFFA